MHSTKTLLPVKSMHMYIRLISKMLRHLLTIFMQAVIQCISTEVLQDTRCTRDTKKFQILINYRNIHCIFSKYSDKATEKKVDAVNKYLTDWNSWRCCAMGKPKARAGLTWSNTVILQENTKITTIPSWYSQVLTKLLSDEVCYCVLGISRFSLDRADWYLYRRKCQHIAWFCSLP